VTDLFFNSSATISQLSNPLWDYACTHYQQPEVQQCCLQMQQYWGADINVLLTAGWAAEHGWEPDWSVILTEVSRWQQEIVGPLRNIRHQLSKANTLENSLRQELLSLELSAEKIELAQLYKRLLEGTDHKIHLQYSAVRLTRQNIANYLSLLIRKTYNKTPTMRVLTKLLSHRLQSGPAFFKDK
jgi:uncharacterized protein (TIGR02444 family)